MDITSLARAVIINIDKGGPPLQCHFNPNEYRLSKQNTWTPGGNGGQNVSDYEFGGGQPETLQMKLLFDTYAEQQDVRKLFTDRLLALMLVDETLRDRTTHKGRPPRVRFQWGASWSFAAVITSINQHFTLFLANGMPVRATVDVVFQQFKDDTIFPWQNPTSGGTGGERVWTVTEGDTLRSIAYREYGDVSQWRFIADANRLTTVRRLRPGTKLRIPSRRRPSR
jgi:nucleoid-associated protein YgaU